MDWLKGKEEDIELIARESKERNSQTVMIQLLRKRINKYYLNEINK